MIGRTNAINRFAEDLTVELAEQDAKLTLLEQALADKGVLPEQDKTVTAGTEVITVQADENYRLGVVTVNPTPSESVEVTAGTEDVTLEASDGKLIDSVVVKPTPTQSKEVTASEDMTITPDEGFHLSEVIVKKGSGGEGTNVWQKCSPTQLTATVAIDVALQYSNYSTDSVGKYIKGTITVTGDLSISDLTDDDFVGAKMPCTVDGGNHYIELQAGHVAYGSNFTATKWAFDGSVIKIYTESPPADIYAGSFTKTQEDVLGYVVSNNASEYPNGAEHTDGYRYVLLESVA